MIDLNVTKNQNVLMWFRSDLRVDDNRALEGALKSLTARAKSNSLEDGLFCIFVVSVGEWKEHDVSKFKVDFILRNVQELKKRLMKHNIPLIVKTALSKTEVPEILLEISKLYQISEVFCNIEYEFNERSRDKKTKALLMQNNVEFKEFHDQCVVPPHVILSSEKQAFKVYTPFKKAWMKVVSQDESYLRLSEMPLNFNQLNLQKCFPSAFEYEAPTSSAGFESSSSMAKTGLELYPAGEKKALERMENFISDKLAAYKEDRDFVCKPGTSVISPYLTCGVISPRQCIHMARQVNEGKLETGDPGAVKWILEIVWREFFRFILVAFPRVSKSLPFIPEAITIKWDEKEGHFDAWKEGRTGYPLVDAGMRELKSTGWISNRIRMTAASFLTKDLLINWQKGEKHFMEHLVDGDLASNNGGWQWAASTGTDPKPYLRIFNPVLQSVKFDPNGDYIRKWVPELRSVSSKKIHEPFKHLSKDQFLQLDYPKPIVDHHKTKEVAEKVYGAAIKLGNTEAPSQARRNGKSRKSKRGT